MDRDFDREPVPTRTANAILATGLPEAGEAIGRAVGGFFAALRPEKKIDRSDIEKLKEENKKLKEANEEAQKAAMYSSSLKSKH